MRGTRRIRGTRKHWCVLWCRRAGEYRLRQVAHADGIATHLQGGDECQRGTEHERQLLLGGRGTRSKLDPEGFKEIPETDAQEACFWFRKEGCMKCSGQVRGSAGGARERERISLLNRDLHGRRRKGIAISRLQIGNQEVGPFAHASGKVGRGKV